MKRKCGQHYIVSETAWSHINDKALWNLREKYQSF